jgi:hypothetical protein
MLVRVRVIERYTGYSMGYPVRLQLAHSHVSVPDRVMRARPLMTIIAHRQPEVAPTGWPGRCSSRSAPGFRRTRRGDGDAERMYRRPRRRRAQMLSENHLQRVPHDFVHESLTRRTLVDVTAWPLHEESSATQLGSELETSRQTVVGLSEVIIQS